MKKKKGISLIVLVITILVMIILAGVVIVSLQENNPIGKAKEAVLRTNIAQIIEDVNMYILNHLDNEKEKYPVKGQVKEDELSIELKEFLASEQGAFLANGLPDIQSIDYSKLFWLDSNKIKSATAFKNKLILKAKEGGSADLYFEKAERLGKDKYYKLGDLSLDLSRKTQFIAGFNNTFKLYEDGTLASIGEVNSLSGITPEESDSLKITWNTKYVSPMGEDVVEEVYGDDTIYAKKSNGDVYALGSNREGKLGFNHMDNIVKPTKLNMIDSDTKLPILNVDRIFTGVSVTYISTKDGKLYGAGRNAHGQLGIGNSKKVYGFHEITLPDVVRNGETVKLTTKDIKRMTNNDSITFLLTTDGKLYAAGYSAGNKFTKVELPVDEENYKIKQFFTGGYDDNIILLENGNVYSNKRFKEYFNLPWNNNFEEIKSLSGTEEIAEFNSYRFFSDYYTYTKRVNGKREMYLTAIRYKENNDVNTKEKRDIVAKKVDTSAIDNFEEAKIISASKILYKGKLYQIQGDRNNGYYLKKININYDISEISEEYRRRYIKDTNGNKYILGMDYPLNISKLIRDKQKKIRDNIIYVNTYGRDIDAIDDKHNLLIQLQKTGIKNVSKFLRDYGAMLLKRDGTLEYGSLKNNGIDNPKIIKNVADIACSNISNMMYLTKNNELYWIGRNGFIFYKPNENQFINSFQKVELPGIPENIKKIYLTVYSNILLTEKGEVYTYGERIYNGFNDKQEKYRKLELPTPVIDIKVFNKYNDFQSSTVFLLLQDGTVYAWGHNEKGQFGDGYDPGMWYNTPQKLNLTDVTNISLGQGYSIIQKKDGKVYGAGRNEYGQLGTGNTNNTNNKFVYSEELSRDITK